MDSRRRRDFQSGGGDARNGPSSRAGDGRSFNDDSSNWKRENNSSSFSGDRRGGGDGGEIGGGINESEGAWKRSGFDSADSSNRGAPRGGESSWGREDFSGRRQNDFSNDGRQSSQSR